MVGKRLNEQNLRFRYLNRLVWRAVALVAVLGMSMVGCQQRSGPTPSVSITLTLPPPTTDGIFTFPLTEDLFQGELSVEGKPILMQLVRLKLSITPMDAASSAVIKLFLPDSVELVKGDREWTGNFSRGQTIVYEVALKTTRTGVSRVRFYVEAAFIENHVEANNYFVFFLSSANCGEISFKPFEDEQHPQQQPTPGGEQ